MPDEAALLWGRPIRDERALLAAGRDLSARFHTAFLMKGGHLGGRIALDILCVPETEPVYFPAPRIRGVNLHGSGCTMSAAITAGLARGMALVDAVGLGKRYMIEAIDRRLRLGRYDVLNVLPPRG